MKHIHAEVIHAFADGALVQVRTPGSEHWANTVYPDFDKKLEYRIKPEPAAPKWPLTTLPEGLLVSKWFNGGPVRGADEELAAMWRIVNAGIEYECSIGALVPTDKVREIEAKARAEGKREGLHPVAVIQAACNHMRLGDIDADTIQIILLKAAQL